MRHLLPALALAAAISAAPISSQNLVTNGDFSSTTIAPWTASGYAIQPGLTNFDVNGTGSSQCYGARPGGQNGPPFLPHKIEQPITWLPIDYELAVDVAHVGSLLSFSLLQGQIDVFAGNQNVASFRFAVQKRRLQRVRLCTRFKPTTTGVGPLRLELSYKGNATATSPQLLIDNVDLRLSRNAQFCIIGDRILGRPVSFEVTGTSSAAFVVWLSLSELPKPVQIPGIRGDFALGLQVLIPFLQGALDSTGRFTQTITVPNLSGLAGTKLYWQTLQIAPTGASLGWHSQQAFYL